MISFKKIEGTDIYEYIINNKVSKESLEEINNFLRQESKKELNLKVLGVIKEFDGFEGIEAFIEGIKIDFLQSGKIKKYALLTNKNWLERLGQLGDILTPGLPVKILDLDKREEAMKWLKE